MTSIDDCRLPQPLPPHIKDVLVTMFATYENVVVKHEFSEGFSGSRVFLIRPILENGRPELPSVVKIDEYDRIEKEWEAYTTCIQNRLPSVASISGKPVYLRGNQYGGLRYPLAGDGAFDVISLQTYCQQASIDDMRYVFGRLFKSLGKLWEQKKVHAELHLAAAYDSFLPPNLLLEWTAVSTDNKTAWLHPETYQQQQQSLEIGDSVQVAGFQITRIWRDSQTMTLDIPSDSSGAYQIRCQDVPDIAAYKVGQIVTQPLTCRVMQTRMGILQEQAAKALGKDVDLTAVMLPFPNRDPMLNPLLALPELLNQSFDAHTSCIHSDLHLGNVLVEPESGNIHLIDFVNAGEFQLLRDFLNLELATVTRVLPSDLSDPQQIIPFYEQLRCALHHAGEVELPEGLERPFATLLAIRQAAQNYFFKRNEWREYYSGLVVYLLGSLRYGDLDGIDGSKQIAFWGATAVLNLLENEMECDGVGDGIGSSVDKQGEEMQSGQSGSAVYGDVVHGDKVGGDKIGGNKITSQAAEKENHPPATQTIFHGPVSGSIHTGSGDINITNIQQPKKISASELEDTVSSGVKLFIDADASLPKLLGNIPPRPSLVIGRENDIYYLKNRIGVGKVEKSPLTVVRGWPGVGKTTTVLTLVHQPGIAEVFPDGVLWVALGENPNPFSELASWGRALGVDDIGRLPTIEEAMARLTAVLRHKQMLLIIDDVWETEHGLPFKIAGESCATVFTTRFQDVARALADIPDKQIYKLPVLTDEKALELLGNLTPNTVEKYPDDSMTLVSDDLEGLPLAIQVAGRLLNEEHGMGWDVADLIADLREGAKLLAAAAPADRADIVNQTTPTVAALLKKSTDTLSEEIQINFAFLGAFAPKPATFDLGAMTAVWLADDPKPSIRILVNRGLLEPVAERYQMHALLVAHAKSLLEDE